MLCPFKKKETTLEDIFVKATSEEAVISDNEEETEKTIGEYYKTGYLIDTHTAVAANVLAQYRAETGDDAVTVVASTASPFKFAPDVVYGITGEREEDPFVASAKLAELAGVDIPAEISSLQEAPIMHTTVCAKDGMDKAVKDVLSK